MLNNNRIIRPALGPRCMDKMIVGDSDIKI